MKETKVRAGCGEILDHGCVKAAQKPSCSFFLLNEHARFSKIQVFAAFAHREVFAEETLCVLWVHLHRCLNYLKWLQHCT